MLQLGKVIAVSWVALISTSIPARVEEAYVAPVKAAFLANVAPWIGDKIIIDAIKHQNVLHSVLTQPEIDSLDKKWRAEVKTTQRPLIDSILSNSLSAYLMHKKKELTGLVTEIFIMDFKGLNVGQSDITSDYWQGDEDKWIKTYAVGPNAIFVDKIEHDESSQSLQVQISTTINDPSTGQPIGAITVGLNAEKL